MRRTTRSLPLAAVLVAALALVASACGSDGGSDGAAEQSSGVEVADAWVRATPEGATAGAAYMVLSSEDGDTLVAASVPSQVAGVTELHETVMADSSDTTMADTDAMDEDMGSMDDGHDHDSDSDMEGMGEMTMREVTGGIEVPAGGSVALEPGGYHVMLLDLVAPLEVGETVQITLTFEKAGTVVVDAPVKES